MARTGQFGRAPRAVPNLSALMLSLAREQERARAQNIMSAWERGGLFEGKKATDSMVLAFWREKIKGLAKNDPYYDEYNNTVLQLQYAIEQSKQDLLHVQGKISDAQFAQFYLKWATKIPKDSEFYRQLQKDAAQLKQGSDARGRAAAEKAKVERFNSFVGSVTGSHIALGDTMVGVMTQIARDNNIIGRDEDLSKMMLKGQDDPAIMESVLASLNADMKANPAKYKDLIDAIKKLDPSWNGQLTSAYFAQTMKRQAEGYSLIKKRAAKDGYTQYVQWATKGIADAHENAIEAKAWPAGQAYALARKEYDEEVADPNATAADRIAAADRFARKIDKIGNTPGLDPSFKNRLANDAKALRGDPTALPQPSFNESFLGLKGTTAGTIATGSTETDAGAQQGEVARWAQQQERDRALEAAMQANPGALVYAHQKADTFPPEFDESGKGPIGPVTVESVTRSGQDTQVIPTVSGGGKPIILAVNEHNVYVVDPETGKRLPDPVGKAITYYNGGQEVTLYKTTRPDGSPNWTAVNPYSGSQSRDNGDIIIKPTVPPADPATEAANAQKYLNDKGVAGDFAKAFTASGGGQAPSGTTWTFARHDKVGEKGGNDLTITVTWKNGKLYTSESFKQTDGSTGALLGASTQPDRPVSGATNWTTAVRDKSRNWHDPKIDFDTPQMAAASANNMTREDMRTVWNNPQFQTVLAAAEYNAAGGNDAKRTQISLNDHAIASDITSHGPMSQSDKFAEHASPMARARRAELRFPDQVGAEDTAPPSESVSIKFGQALRLPSGTNFQTPTGTPVPGGYTPAAGQPGGPPVPTPKATMTPTGTQTTTDVYTPPPVPATPAPYVPPIIPHPVNQNGPGK